VPLLPLREKVARACRAPDEGYPRLCALVRRSFSEGGSACQCLPNRRVLDGEKDGFSPRAASRAWIAVRVDEMRPRKDRSLDGTSAVP